MRRLPTVLLVLLAGCATTADAPAEAPRAAPSPIAPVVATEPAPPPPRPPLPPPPPAVVAPPVAAAEPAAATGLAHTYRDAARRILAAARASPVAWERLTYLCDVIGHRLSGSKALEKAVAWTAETMRADGLDEVRTEPVMVPFWVRGEERAVMTAPREQELNILGLGLSVGTPEGGIEAEVMVCGDFDELEARAAEVPGKIVLFDYPMPPYSWKSGSGYGSTVRYRTAGASRAGEKGALAVLVRSVTAKSLSTPHTGMLSYQLGKPRIPAAAVTIEEAAMIARLVAAGETVRVRLEMGAHTNPAAQSANVVGEIRGSALPHEVVVFGGHLDSWDVGQGAHDDGGACIAVMEAMRLLRVLGLRPRRTIRAVLFTNEENGLAGATQYALQHREELKDHVAAIEMDSGTFRPLGLRTPEAKDAAGERRWARLADLLGLFREIGADRLTAGGGGADIGPMAPSGVPQIGLDVEGSRYFDYHHTHADTLDKVDREDLAQCAAVLATTVYVLADMPERLGE